MTGIERLQTGGILRRGSRRSGFRYVYAADGRSAARERGRIDALRIPPAWREVAVSRSPTARLQAVGRDGAGRWQYRYHEAHVRIRERRKFERLLRFGAALPRLRARVTSDLRRRGLPRDKVLATVIRILAAAFIRPGSEAYAAQNGSHGIATLRRKHVSVRADRIDFDFPAKSGVRQQCTLQDRVAARTIRQLLRLPGYEVFKFVESGRVVDLKRADITAYVKRHMGDAFTAKDFRTWTATLLCACALADADTPTSRRATRTAIAASLRATAQQLGNTPAVCRASYVSPCVLQAFEQGQVIPPYGAIVEQVSRLHAGLHPAERALLRLLNRSRDGAGARPALRAAA